MKKQNRTAIYIRVSTVSQKPDLQLDGLEAYAARAEMNITDRKSGRNDGFEP